MLCVKAYNGMACKDRYHQFMQSKHCLSPSRESFLSKIFQMSRSDMNSFCSPSPSAKRFIFSDPKILPFQASHHNLSSHHITLRRR